jgi:hypothetical protein
MQCQPPNVHVQNPGNLLSNAPDDQEREKDQYITLHVPVFVDWLNSLV